MSNEGEDGPIFKDISDDTVNDVQQIESLCMACYKQGITRLLLTKIPFFRDVVLSSFECEHCGHSDNGIQSADRIQDRATKFVLQVTDRTDMDRQVIKSERAVLHIPSLEFEQPPSKKGEVTTVEGLVGRVIDDLEMFQEQRREQDPDTANKLDAFLSKMKSLLSLEAAPFEMILDDVSGNSYIENPDAPKADAHMQVINYKRSKVQDLLLGIQEPDQIAEEEEEEEEKEENLKNEVMNFRTNCPECNAPCDTNMKLIDIPYFKETIIMATICDECGFRDNEVKGGTGFGDKAKKIKLRLTDPTDLSRDVLKSDTCDFSIPELEIDVHAGASGGRFTTLEGLFVQIIETFEKKMPFIVGDSGREETKTRMAEVIGKLKKASKGEMLNIHVILDDPAGNSYLQNFYAPDDDPEMEITEYERTEDQEDFLGIKDMNTDNYREDV